MSPPVFVDANIPIYAAGRPHPLKEPAARILALAADAPEAFVTDVEVVQELMHRYLALRVWDAGRLVVAQFLVLMDGRIEPVLVEDISEAARLADGRTEVPARDLLHASVMMRIGAHRIVTADTDFDRFPDFERLSPATVDSWVASIEA